MLRRATTSVLLLALALVVVPRIPADAEVHDSTYGVGGVASGDFTDGRQPLSGKYATDDGSGRTVVLDWKGAPAGANTRGRLTRFTASGQPDVSFGDDGDVVLPEQFMALYPTAVAGHGIVVWGLWNVDGVRRDTFVRVTDDGDLDERLGPGGMYQPAEDVKAILPFLGQDGSVVFYKSGPDALNIAVVGEDGRPDEGFGDGGVVELYGWPVARDAEGRTLYREGACPGTSPCQSFRRLLPDGSVDPAFPKAGQLVVPQTADTALGDTVVSVRGDLMYVVTTSTTGLGVTRVRDGVIDPTFGTNGTAIVPIGVPNVNAGTVLTAALADGGFAIAAAGTGLDAINEAPSSDVAVLTTDGVLDQRFGQGGVQRISTQHVIGLAAAPSSGVRIARATNEGRTAITQYALVAAPLITNVTERSDGITVDWYVPDQLADDTVLYEVVARTASSIGAFAVVANDVRSVTLVGLATDKSYEVSVRPYSRTGAGPASDPVVASADADGPAATLPGAPSSVLVEPGSSLTPGRVRVSWSSAPDNGSPLLAYGLAAFDKATGRPVAFRVVGPDARSAVLTGLGVGASSEVWVFGWSAEGIGEPARVDVVPGTGSALTAGPVVPWAVAWNILGTTTVTWGAAQDGREPLEGYDVIVWVDGQLRSWTQTGPFTRQVSLPVIPAGSAAQVYVTGHGATELGPFGNPIAVVTPT
jgi:hypothetical protein